MVAGAFHCRPLPQHAFRSCESHLHSRLWRPGTVLPSKSWRRNVDWICRGWRKICSIHHQGTQKSKCNTERSRFQLRHVDPTLPVSLESARSERAPSRAPRSSVLLVATSRHLAIRAVVLATFPIQKRRAQQPADRHQRRKRYWSAQQPRRQCRLCRKVRTTTLTVCESATRTSLISVGRSIAMALLNPRFNSRAFASLLTT